VVVDATPGVGVGDGVRFGVGVGDGARFGVGVGDIRETESE
jgi:hypothetical protein